MKRVIRHVLFCLYYDHYQESLRSRLPTLLLSSWMLDHPLGRRRSVHHANFDRLKCRMLYLTLIERDRVVPLKYTAVI
jgi:hypothetical protein